MSSFHRSSQFRAAIAVDAPPAIPTEPIWRITVEQYHQMIDSGILTEDNPVELLAGWLVYKMPKKPPHRAATKLTRDALEKIIPVGFYVDGQEPITLADSEPEPDVMIIRGSTRDYLDRHPGAADVVLVIEVADSTLERDRDLKQQLYAQAGIPEYWILNLSEQQLEVYSNPISETEQPSYQTRLDYRLDDEIAIVIDGQTIGRVSVKDLFP